jgi:dihydrofolate synthase/folylpolyglutamate synthase
VIAATAEEVGAPLWVAAEGGLERAGAATRPYPTAPVPALRGGFQRENARLALGASMLLRDAGLPIGDGAMAAGLATVSWPGRFELLPLTPLVLIDGAHNGDSAHKLMAAIKAELGPPRMVLILGTSRDKDIAAIAAALAPHAAAVVLTRSHHHRAMDLDRIAAEVRAHLNGPLLVAADVAAALDAARGLAGPADLICITGSLFVVADAREALGLAASD